MTGKKRAQIFRQEIVRWSGGGEKRDRLMVPNSPMSFLKTHETFFGKCSMMHNPFILFCGGIMPHPWIKISKSTSPFPRSVHVARSYDRDEPFERISRATKSIHLGNREQNPRMGTKRLLPFTCLYNFFTNIRFYKYGRKRFRFRFINIDIMV